MMICMYVCLRFGCRKGGCILVEIDKTHDENASLRQTCRVGRVGNVSRCNERGLGEEREGKVPGNQSGSFGFDLMVEGREGC